ncbi:MAG TPA: AAA family ATPase [Chthoniobacteraceae bacterium]|nr:AAA family ATPase [Chthoniobacteraceae bacterium]
MSKRRAKPSEALVAFLRDPKSYPHRPRSVRFVQTHASLVFIAPPFVFKVKKPVNFGFLDFSTLAKRRAVCEREVTLNRRLASRVYLGVVPIVRRRSGLAIGGRGKVVEFAVQMRHLGERGFLDRTLARGAVGVREIDRIATVLARFYKAQHPTADIEDWGHVGRLRVSTDENFAQTRRFIGQTISAGAFAAIRAYTNEFFQRHARRLERRVREGWIRDGHGDLHLEHIHLTPNAVTIYDCIEFNDRFRFVDVASDVAFLAMDLDFCNRSDLAQHFARKMARALHDDGMPALLDFYKCYRAFVRGKVESLQSIAPLAPAANRDAAAKRAGRYFRLALRYAVTGSNPLVLAVMGRIGSGKSALATALARELGCAAFSSDQLRKELAGRPLFKRTPPEQRARLYAPAMNRRTYAALRRRAAKEAKRGHCVIADATFGKALQRAQFKRALANAGARVIFLEAYAGDRTLRARLRRREACTHEVSDARVEDFAKLAGAYEPPAELKHNELARVSTAKALKVAVGDVLRKLALMASRAR